MVVLARKQAAHSVLGSPANDLCLQIVGSQRHGQTVRLSAPKCTVGSGRGCTLRLRAAGVRPLHCLILRGALGTVARCWSGDTRLNGSAFTDRLLSPGDTLAVGPIELTVVDLGNEPPREETLERRLPAPAVEPLEAARQRGRQLLALARRLKSTRGELQARVDQLTGLHAEHAVHREQIEERLMADFEQMCRQWESGRLESEAVLAQRGREISEAQARLEHERQNIEQQQRAWQEQSARERSEQESRLAELRRELDQQAASLRQSDEELRRSREALEQQQAVWAAESANAKCELEGQLAALQSEREAAAVRQREAEAFCAREHAEFEARSAEFDARQQQWQQRQSEHEGEWAQRRADLEREQGELAAAREQLDRSRAELADSQQALAVAQVALADREEELGARLSVAHQELDERGRLAEARRSELDEHEQATLQELAQMRSELASQQQSLEEQRLAFERERQQPVSPEEPRPDEDSPEQIAREEQQLRQQAAFEERCAAVAEQELALKAAQVEVESLGRALREENERVHHEMMQRSQYLADERQSLLTELERLRGESHERGSALEVSLAAAHEQLVLQRGALQEAAAAAARQAESPELHAREQQLSERESRMERILAELSDRQAELDASRAELEALQRSLREETEQSRQLLSAERQRVAQDREALLTELEQQRAQWHQQRTEAAVAPTAGETLAGEELPLPSTIQEVECESESGAQMGTDDDAMITTAEISESVDDEALEEMRRRSRERLRAARQETSPELDEADEEDLPSERSQSARARSRSADTGGEDESIEDHIAAWLNKRCASGQAPVVPASESKHRQRKSDPKPEPLPASQPTKAATSATLATADVPVIDMPPTLTELVRRSQPAETGNFAAMRELGKTHAQISITSYDKKRMRQRAVLDTILSATCLLGSFVVWFAVPEGNILRMLPLIASVAGIYWGLSALVAYQKWLVNRQRQRSGQSRMLSASESQP